MPASWGRRGAGAKELKNINMCRYFIETVMIITLKQKEKACETKSNDTHITTSYSMQYMGSKKEKVAKRGKRTYIPKSTPTTPMVYETGTGTHLCRTHTWLGNGH